ncbi:MAG: NAD-binding protein [Bacteroidota bacterium]
MSSPLRPFYRIYISIIAFGLILLIGTWGFMYLEDYTAVEALYMTVITISTVGFTEVRPLDDAGRWFCIVLILVNLGVFTYFLGQLSNYFLDGEFIKVYKLYKMKKSISELRNHVIICGFGRNGREAAKMFSLNGRDFVGIEKKATRKDDLPYEVPYYLEDDATRDETLLEAGIMHATALLTTLPDDADNLFVVLTARELNPKIKIISRASQDTSVRKLKTAGANHVIMPDKIGGSHMATLVLSPDVEEFVDLMATQNSEHFSIEEVESAKTITLDDLNCWKITGATILGVKASAGEYALNPVPATVVLPGHRIIVMGSKQQLQKVRTLLS